MAKNCPSVNRLQRGVIKNGHFIDPPVPKVNDVSLSIVLRANEQIGHFRWPNKSARNGRHFPTITKKTQGGAICHKGDMMPPLQGKGFRIMDNDFFVIRVPNSDSHDSGIPV